MANLLTRGARFGCNTVAREVLRGTCGHSDMKADVGVRVVKVMCRNEGDQNVVFNLDGSSNAGSSWTNRATVTVKARSHAVLQGAVRGKEDLYRITAAASSGESTGSVEVFDESDSLTR